MNNCLTFTYDNIDYEFNIKSLTFKRESKDFCLKLNFIKKMGSYLLKITENIIDLKLIIKKLQLDKNKVIIDYQIEDNNFTFQIFYTEE